MYVKELIKCLKRCNPDAEVRFEGSDGFGTHRVDVVAQKQTFVPDEDDDVLCALRCDDGSHKAWREKHGLSFTLEEEE